MIAFGPIFQVCGGVRFDENGLVTYINYLFESKTLGSFVIHYLSSIIRVDAKRAIRAV